MKPFIGRATAIALGALASVGILGAEAADKPYDGVTLNLASQNDQFAAVLAALAPQFESLTGAKVNVDILSYPELLTKITADYVGHTKGYDLATVDIVWSGQFAEAGYTVDLTDWIKRDAAEIKVDDIYPSLMAALGGYRGKQVAFPFAGYANVLAYRKDLYEGAMKYNMQKAMSLQGARGVFKEGGSTDVNSDAVAQTKTIAETPGAMTHKAEPDGYRTDSD